MEVNSKSLPVVRDRVMLTLQKFQVKEEYLEQVVGNPLTQKPSPAVRQNVFK